MEVAAIGCEGMSAPGAILGGDAALKSLVVQVGGPALVMTRSAFHRLQNENAAFREALRADAKAFLGQVMQTVACNAVHTSEERASRWLLMRRDRAGGDTFPLTQEFFAGFLGVSRPTVSLIARTQQRAGLITYKRGRLKALDRAGLEETACECYQTMLSQYREAMTTITVQIQ